MLVGKFTEPVASDAMSGLRYSIAPRCAGSRPRPPVENCTMIPGQCLRTPSWIFANASGSEPDDWSGLRTWMCTSEAPASKASCVDSICSAGVTGTAGLSAFFGTEPVIATVMMTGWAMVKYYPPDGRAQPHVRRPGADRRADPHHLAVFRVPAQGRRHRGQPQARQWHGASGITLASRY